MGNKLTAPQAGEPLSITAGDKARWRRDDLKEDYAAAEGWSLSYRFLGPGNSAKDVPAAADAEGWLATADAAAWPVGHWNWFLIATHATHGRTTVASGALSVLIDPLATLPADYDPRSHARRVLEAIEAAIEGRASKTDLEVTMADGRSIKRLSHKELLDMRDTYAAKVRAEERKAAGKGPGRVLVRL